MMQYLAFMNLEFLICTLPQLVIVITEIILCTVLVTALETLIRMKAGFGCSQDCLSSLCLTRSWMKPVVLDMVPLPYRSPRNYQPKCLIQTGPVRLSFLGIWLLTLQSVSRCSQNCIMCLNWGAVGWSSFPVLRFNPISALAARDTSVSI